jgi:2-polyprenyl-6-methoxyphenol hydroxylase-like FAD-dependent oxidoreductase
MTAVVIAGAGPNGLRLAAELAMAGVHPLVLDAAPDPSEAPKANGLVGQVVRALDMRGLYGRLGGTPPAPGPIPAYTFSGIPLPLAEIDDNPMYALLVPQPKLVRHLIEWLGEFGVVPRWNHAVIDVSSGPDGVTVAVAGPDGHYRIDTRYLVGADGGRSRVRKSTGIAFPGVTSDMTLRLGHVHIPDALRGVGGSIDVAGAPPIPFGHNRFDNGMLVFAQFEPHRSMLGTMEFGAGDLPDAPMSLAELRDSINRVAGIDVPIEEPAGDGPNAQRRINGQNTRQAQHYRVGNVFLLGDAAHVHSAMGGPGLNLGLMDALNLGWKLAAAVRVGTRRFARHL